MIRLGGPVFVPATDPELFAREHRRLGYSAAYLPDISLAEATLLVAALHRENVALAEAGAWRNLLATDPAIQKENFGYVCARLALADEVGARCCVDYLGTFDPHSDYGPHPRNLTQDGFDAAVETVRRVIDAVKPRRAKFCLEMMQWILPDSVESYVQLLKTVDRPAFGAHLDPVNLIVSPRQYFDNGTVIRSCFEKLGPWIAGCHAKDIRLRNELALHFDEVPPGDGLLDYTTFLRELSRLPGDNCLMLEHLATPEQYATARNHLAMIAADAQMPLRE